MKKVYEVHLRELVLKKKGQGVAEYVLVIGFIALVAITALSSIGRILTGLFNTFIENFKK